MDKKSGVLQIGVPDLKNIRVLFSPSRIDKSVYVLLVFFAAFLIVFGYKFHTVIDPSTAENDDYVDMAKQISMGKLPIAPRNPLLYPILSAAAGRFLGNDMFAGARLTSSIFAVIFVLFAYFLGSLCFDKRVGFFTFLAVMLNPVTVLEGLHATTDMTFSALTLLTLLVSIYVIHKINIPSVLLLAFSFSLMYFTRYGAIAILPTLAIVFILAPSVSKKNKIILGLIFLAASFLFLLPHFYLTRLAFGNPFHNEWWKGLLFKLYGHGDRLYVQTFPYDGVVSVFLRSPKEIIITAGRELGQFFHQSLNALGGDGIPGSLFIASFLAGVYYVLFSLNRRKIIIVFFTLSYILEVCLFFVTWTRIMLPILPLCYMLIGNFIILSDLFKGHITLGKLKIKRYIPVIAVFLGISLCNSVLYSLPDFIKRHPYREVEAALWLQQRYGSNIKVAGTYPYFHRHTNYTSYDLCYDFSYEPDTNAYYAKLKSFLHEKQINYIVVGKRTVFGKHEVLLKSSEQPSFLRPIVNNEDFTIYEVIE